LVFGALVPLAFGAGLVAGAFLLLPALVFGAFGLAAFLPDEALDFGCFLSLAGVACLAGEAAGWAAGVAAGVAAGASATGALVLAFGVLGAFDVLGAFVALVLGVLAFGALVVFGLLEDWALDFD